MKNVLAFTLFLITGAAYAGPGYWQVAKVSCDFSSQQSMEIEKIELVSTRFHLLKPPVSPSLILFYRKGGHEVLTPKAKSDEFGLPKFTDTIDFKKGKLFFPRSGVGEIFLDFECYHSPGIPWERCQSQGSGAHGSYSRVLINFGGKVAHFVGDNLCRRTVEQAE